MIWEVAWDTLLKQASKQGWKGFKETPLSATGWLEDGPTGRLQPDGILYRDAGEGTQIVMLDLTRCRGYDTDAFQSVAQQKELKYGHAAHLLEQVGNVEGRTCSARILALPIGHTGNISEYHWDTLTTTLELGEKAKAKICTATTAAGLQAFSFMITMWKEARRERHTHNEGPPHGDTCTAGARDVNRT
jgi:hypothetical protein